MEKGRIEFSLTSMKLEGNYENVQIFFYINSNCVFSKTIPLWGQVSQPASEPIV